jgi:hypothetical protein
MAEMGIADYFAKGADWIAQKRTRRRIQYERATHARPDYGRPAPSLEWFHISDGILLSVGSALRAVAVTGYVIAALLTVGFIWLLLSILGGGR